MSKLRVPRTRARAAAVTGVAALLLSACSGSTKPTEAAGGTDPVAALESCGTRTELFTVSPIALTDFRGWAPLGNVSAPLHTFPAAHQYLFHTLAGAPLHTVPVVSPGNIVLVGASRRVYTADGRSDYSLQFAMCREVTGYFNHVAVVDASILSRFPAFDQMCFSSSTAPAYNDCSTKGFALPVATGAPIGITGGVAGLLAWDFGLRDSRVPPIPYANPARWDRGGINGDLLHVVAPSDYYAEPARSQIAARLGRGDGTERRTIPPLGGTLDVDVPGSAQGMWFNTAQLGGTEGPHLALVPDSVDPMEFAFSGSESLPGYSPAVAYWRPAASGFVNPAPRTIVADGQLRCLNMSNGRSALLLLVDSNTLRAEVRPAGVTCAAQQPWTFGPSAFVFHR